MISVKKFMRLYDIHGSMRAVVRASNGSLLYHQAIKLHAQAVKKGLITNPRKTCKTVSERTGKVSVGSGGGDNSSRRESPDKNGSIHTKSMNTREIPKKGHVKTYLFTSAQNNTNFHNEFWENLIAFKEYLGAELHVSRFTYKKNGLSSLATKGKKKRSDEEDMWWDKRIAPYQSDGRIQIAPGIVWCGDMDILPTAVRPLSGLDSYTGRDSGIFPHTKIALESVASNKHDGTKFNYTTGAVTLRNYIQRKAGMKAEFHHCYSALLVEVDSDGTWFARHINADETGAFYDLDRLAKGNRVSTGHRAAGIYWGDGHDAEKDDVACWLAFGVGGIKHTLRPKQDHIGDVISFKSRSHHEMKDPHLMYLRKCQGLGNVEQEVRNASEFIEGMSLYYQDCKTILVYGNHERHLGRWLKEQDGRFDTTNAKYWSRLQFEVFNYIENHKEEPNYLQIALYCTNIVPKDNVRFLVEDESVIVCPDHGGGIECGMHGDRGPNGSRGTAIGLSKLGRKICIGDKHSAQILDGVYIAGTFSRLDTDWTHGPSSWSHSHIVIYPNGKRAIITCYDGKWRAQ